MNLAPRNVILQRQDRTSMATKVSFHARHAHNSGKPKHLSIRYGYTPTGYDMADDQSSWSDKFHVGAARTLIPTAIEYYTSKPPGFVRLAVSITAHTFRIQHVGAVRRVGDTTVSYLN